MATASVPFEGPFDDSTNGVCIVVTDKVWGNQPDVSGPNKDPLTVVIAKGELVREIPEADRIARDKGSPAHNYCRYDDPSVTFFTNGSSLAQLHGSQHEYLAAIDDPLLRHEEYTEEGKLKWVMGLKKADSVLFKLSTVAAPGVTTIRGTIKYIGKKPARPGIQFGIEIEVGKL